MIASVFLNAFIALFSLVFFSFLLRGNSFADLVTTTQEAVQEISWGLMLAFVGFLGSYPDYYLVQS